MVMTLLVSVAMVGPDPAELLRGLVPSLPPGSAGATLSLMGGVGGSVTLLSYGYWIHEKGWTGPGALRSARLDLGVGYGLTGLFGVAMIVLAAVVLAGAGGLPEGSAGLVACGDAIRDATAARFGDSSARAARLVFLVGVWGAIFTSTLGVWQGIPYLFADFVQKLRGDFGSAVDTRGWAYRGYLVFLAIPPMLLLFLDRPMWIIRVYTITGGLFMPLLASSLLWLNSREKLVGEYRNGRLATLLLVLALALFAVIAARQAIDVVS
jgi:Mn2+/Fe2+ NRAMP family transporter